MARKKIKIYYYWPLAEIDEKIFKIIDLNDLLKELDTMEINKRVHEISGEKVQLKKIDFVESENRWYLCFMKLKDSSPFKTTLLDQGDPIELDDDEYIGEEACAIYDLNHQIIAVQNNRNSVSYNGISAFFKKFMSHGEFSNFNLTPLTYKSEYGDMSDNSPIEYKSLSINFIDLDKLVSVTKTDNDDLVALAGIARHLNALNCKIELSVGKSRNFLHKNAIKGMIQSFWGNNKNVKSLKVKLIDQESIRLIDLINFKLEDEITINITKEDPKTTVKIFDQMISAFEVTLEEELGKIVKVYVNA